jgi:hypothetical protein
MAFISSPDADGEGAAGAFGGGNVVGLAEVDTSAFDGGEFTAVVLRTNNGDPAVGVPAVEQGSNPAWTSSCKPSSSNISAKLAISPYAAM